MARAVVRAVAEHYVDRTNSCVVEVGGRSVEIGIDPDESFDSLAARIAVGLESSDRPPSGEMASGDGGAVLSGVVVALLPQVLADGSRPIRTYPLLGDAERDKILCEFNATDVAFPDDLTIYDLLRARAEDSADRIAVSTDDGTLTYGRLADRAERLSTFLARRDHGAHGVVAVLARRTLDLPVSLFGILGAGLAYLPLDPCSPPERLRQMIGKCGVTTILADRDCPVAACLTSGEGSTREVFALDAAELYARAGGAKPPEPRDLCYVIHTSGSTGEPKGVMVEHRSVMNRLAWMQRRFPLAGQDVVLQKTPIVFDVSVWELFWWLFGGARMHLMRPGAERFPLAIEETIEKHDVSVVHFVPSMLNVFLSHLRTEASAHRLAGLRLLFSSGETLLPPTAAAFDELLGRNGAQLVNLYGPTETTVDVTAFECPAGPPPDRIPIGRPIDNTRMYVLRHGQPVPVGVYGTLFVAGAGVARGYLDDQARTAERFLPEPGHPGQSMYDTGDICRWTAAGELEYLGRDDLQIKIRGIRVELGEVEHALLEVPLVAGCVVFADSADPVRVVLRAVVTEAKGNVHMGNRPVGLTGDRLRTEVARKLPGYLIPASFDLVEALPLTATGKVDRTLLARPEFLQTHGTRL
ncbi:amino acid adenylation domain-containing protein [Nonomuraea basaltis]|uniref:amino acid adenylation domain-containing protein n=1 Tax=Nonomuraea basaltis TaxID=2495887 RepID=UPI0014874A2F|nr:amino acid adenylation domain-containing protein [Nonomuraea basaltis]